MTSLTQRHRKQGFNPLSRQKRNLPLVSMDNVATIILGGGQGSRLFPLTNNRCKPAISFGGRYRLVDVPVSNAINCGCHKIFILTQFLSSTLHQHIVRTYHFDTFSSGFIELLPAEQKPKKKEWFQGTADAVRQNIEYFKEVPAEYFLILSGDQLYRMDFQEMLLQAKETNADLLIATLPVNAKDANRMGIMKIDHHGEITDFYEKPQQQSILDKMSSFPEDDRPYLASMGIYLFKRQALIDLLEKDKREDFGKHLIPTMVEDGGVYAYQHDGYWEDIGTIESFHNASIALTEPKPEFNCYDENSPIFTSHCNLPGPKIRNTQIKNSIICEGCLIEGDEICSSILGPRTIVREGSILKRTYVMGNDFYNYPLHTESIPEVMEIGENVIIENAILDKFCDIGDNVRLINKDKLQEYDGDNIYIRDGVIVVCRGATIPDGFVL